MFKHFGRLVEKLKRVKIGPLDLGPLKPGEFRYLSLAEVEQLRKAVKHAEARERKQKQQASAVLSKSPRLGVKSDPCRNSSYPYRTALRSAHTIAVVGLSSKRYRPSYGVAEYMQSAGYRIIPVNPFENRGAGRDRPIAELDASREPVDIVDIFRRSEFVPEIVEAAIRIGARAIWMQEGVVHEEAAAKARAAGLEVVMDRCILKEHRRMLVSSNS